MPISNYSTNPDLNTNISGIDIAEGCLPSGINNAIRQMMSDTKVFYDSKNQPGGYLGMLAGTGTRRSSLVLNDDMLLPQLSTTTLAVGATGAGGVSVDITKYADDTSYPSFRMYRGRGSGATPTPPADGDSLGAVRFGKYTGSTWTIAGPVVFGRVDPSAEKLGSYLEFMATDVSEVVKYPARFTAKDIRPGVDNSFALGAASFRWSTVYAVTGTINTSDARVKTVVQWPDSLLEAWGRHVFPVCYKLNDSIESKGFAAARIHTGFLAQAVEAAFREAGLNPGDYGCWCHDSWSRQESDWLDEEEVRDEETGEVLQEAHRVMISPAREAGDRYSLRYDEIMAIEAAYQRWKMKKLEDKIAALEARFGDV